MHGKTKQLKVFLSPIFKLVVLPYMWSFKTSTKITTGQEKSPDVFKTKMIMINKMIERQ